MYFKPGELPPQLLEWNSKFTYPKCHPPNKPFHVRLGAFSTRRLVWRIVFPGFLLLIGWLSMLKYVYSGNPPVMLEKLGYASSGILFVLAGMIMIIRKEFVMQHPSTTRGMFGVALSVLWTSCITWWILLAILEK